MIGMAVNDVGPWTIGQLLPQWTIFLVRVNTTTGQITRPYDLTGIANNQIALQIYNAAQAQIGTGTGTVNIVTAFPAQFTYTLTSSDVPARAGLYYAKFKIGTTTPDFTDFIKWGVSA